MLFVHPSFLSESVDFFDAHFYRRIRITSHTIPISSRTAANAVEKSGTELPPV